MKEWIAADWGKQAIAQVITSQEGLTVYAESLKAGLARGDGVQALRTRLLEEYLVLVSIDLLKQWMAAISEPRCKRVIAFT